MDLQKLFETQKKLDERIVEEKGLEGQDLLDKKILALQVELGELANEQRSWKFWSEDREPRTYGFDDDKDCEYCHGTGTVREHPSDTGYICPDCEGSGFMHYNPLLEEYVDCLHFILSIGNDLEIAMQDMAGLATKKFDNLERTFIDLFISTGALMYRRQEPKTNYAGAFKQLLNLGELLGFTWSEIEQAYYTSVLREK